jgi:lipoprotein signal peptidase
MNKIYLQMGVGGAGMILVDQLSKWLVASLDPQLVELNAGVSFGWFAVDGSFADQAMLSSVLVVFLFLVFLAGYRQLWSKQPLLAGIFFGAVLSNILDRLLVGGVRDWLYIPFTTLKNNMADWCIFFVCAGLAVQELGEIQSSKKKEA